MLMQRLLVCGLLLSAATASAHASQGVPAAPVGDIEPGTAWLLNNAGYVLTEESLIVALSDPDPSVVGAACVFLTRLAQSIRAVDALLVLLRVRSDGPASLAASALYLLSTRRWEHRDLARQWENEALIRLPSMTRISTQLEIADRLARTGRADRWPFVRAGLLRGYRTNAEHLLRFQGLRDETGQPIDVVAELKEVLLDERAAPYRDRLGAALREVRETLERQPAGASQGTGRQQ